VCLEGLGFDYLTAVAAHDQVEVILCRTLAKDGHVCENTHKHSLGGQNTKFRVLQTSKRFEQRSYTCSNLHDSRS